MTYSNKKATPLSFQRSPAYWECYHNTNNEKNIKLRVQPCLSKAQLCGEVQTRILSQLPIPAPAQAVKEVLSTVLRKMKSSCFRDSSVCHCFFYRKKAHAF